MATISSLTDGGALQGTDIIPIVRLLGGTYTNYTVRGIGTVPTGAIAIFPFTVAPSGWLKLNGALINRSTYPELWSAAQASGNIVSDTVWAATNTGSFSTGNGTTTFRIPDLRGEFVRGWDDSRGVDTGRAIGVWQADILKSHAHTISVMSSLPISNGTVPQEPILVENTTAGRFYNVGGYIEATGGTETRPRNASLLYCIKF